MMAITSRVMYSTGATVSARCSRVSAPRYVNVDQLHTHSTSRPVHTAAATRAMSLSGILVLDSCSPPGLTISTLTAYVRPKACR